MFTVYYQSPLSFMFSVMVLPLYCSRIIHEIKAHSFWWSDIHCHKFVTRLVKTVIDVTTFRKEPRILSQLKFLLDESHSVNAVTSFQRLPSLLSHAIPDSHITIFVFCRMELYWHGNLTQSPTPLNQQHHLKVIALRLYH